MTLKDLAVDHSYYCNLGNYFNNDCGSHFNTWSDFMDEFGDADKDYNLLFRWDIKPKYSEEDEEDGIEDNPIGYKMEVFWIAQRKGLYQYSTIDDVTEEDVPSIVEYLTGYATYLKSLWEPIIPAIK